MSVSALNGSKSDPFHDFIYEEIFKIDFVYTEKKLM